MASASVLPSQIGPYKLYYFDLGRTTPGKELEIKIIYPSPRKSLLLDSLGEIAQKTKKCQYQSPCKETRHECVEEEL
ncbi:hypothetical protein AMECASPLE_034436 [Ameca splendens]|uniref:Uncharacterized protein n=1 Tax=Ameca splendens TaxID=208324 RepID=A0ABV0XKA3_9TELE